MDTGSATRFLVKSPAKCKGNPAPALDPVCQKTSFGFMKDSPRPKVTWTVVPSFQAQYAPVPTADFVALSSKSSTLHVDSEHVTP